MSQTEPNGAVEPDESEPELDARQIARRVAPQTVRRSPRYGRFALTGVLVGALVAALAAVLGPPGDALGRGAVFLLLLVALGLAGALLGTVTAVLAERRSVRRRGDEA